MNADEGDFIGIFVSDVESDSFPLCVASCCMRTYRENLKVTPSLLSIACPAGDVQALFWHAVDMSLYASRRRPCRREPKACLHPYLNVSSIEQYWV